MYDVRLGFALAQNEPERDEVSSESELMQRAKVDCEQTRIGSNPGSDPIRTNSYGLELEFTRVRTCSYGLVQLRAGSDHCA